MRSFDIVLEKKIRNPLRKKELSISGEMNYNSPEFYNSLKDYTLYSDIEDLTPEYKTIRLKYDQLNTNSKNLAERYLHAELRKIIERYIRPSTKNYTKIFDYGGVQVFLDEQNVDEDFSVGSYNHRMVRHGVVNMLLYIKDILPNRKPRIVITDISKNKYTSDSFGEEGAGGMAVGKLIFIDWKYIDDPKYYIHEYAHFLTDLIPSQSKKLLVQSFIGLLNEYYTKIKKRKIKPGEPSRISNKVLRNVAHRLGFPEYGTQNPDEFFAMVIETWKELPNNKSGYKFKYLVKNIINRI